MSHRTLKDIALELLELYREAEVKRIALCEKVENIEAFLKELEDEVEHYYALICYEADKSKDDSKWITIVLTPDIDAPEARKHVDFLDIAWQCSRCLEIVKDRTKFCPYCGKRNIRDET